VTWEPFESIPVMKGYGVFAKNLEYSQSKAVGAELGMIMATKDAATSKRDAVQKFVSAYVKKQNELAKDKKAFTDALAKLTGLDMEISGRIAETIKLGAVVTPDQIKRQAKAFHELGVIQKDVSGQIEQFWDGGFVKTATGS
jgi:sulfonate transport system substrate-binding protein